MEATASRPVHLLMRRGVCREKEGWPRGLKNDRHFGAGAVSTNWGPNRTQNSEHSAQGFIGRGEGYPPPRGRPAYAQPLSP